MPPGIKRLGLDVPADRIIITAGAQHALCIVAGALLSPGDLILSESLTYPGLRAVAEMLRLRLRGVPMDEKGLLPEVLDAVCRSEAPRALYCMPGLQNPTGAVMPADRRAAIAAILRRYGVALIEDDIYGFLVGELPPLLALMPELGHYVVGTSKSMGPGFRIGFLVIPPGSNSRYVAALRATTWMAPPLLAEIVCRWIADGTAARMVEAQRRTAADRQVLARRLLAGFDYRAHPNSFYGMLHLPPPWRAGDFVAAGARRGLRLRAAETFTVDQGAPEAVRLCICAVDSVGILTDGLEAGRRHAARGSGRRQSGGVSATHRVRRGSPQDFEPSHALARDPLAPALPPDLRSPAQDLLLPRHVFAECEIWLAEAGSLDGFCAVGRAGSIISTSGALPWQGLGRALLAKAMGPRTACGSGSSSETRLHRLLSRPGSRDAAHGRQRQ